MSRRLVDDKGKRTLCVAGRAGVPRTSPGNDITPHRDSPPREKVDPGWQNATMLWPRRGTWHRPNERLSNTMTPFRSPPRSKKL